MAEEAGRVRGGLIAAALVAGLLYLPGGAVWDDPSLIVEYLSNLNGSGLRSLWSQPVGGGEVGVGYFRPLSMTALSLLGRLGIPAIHLAVALLHAGSTALLRASLKGRPGADYGALLFAVHPMISEVLGWASALPDALSVHLGLWAIYAAPRSLPAAALCTLAGVLSKETALLFLPCALLAGLLSRGWGAWGAGAAAALAWRVLAGTEAAWGVGGKADLVPLAVLWPISSLVWPWPLTAVRDLLAAPGWALPLGAAVLVGMAALARRERLAWGGVALFVAAPVMALPPTLEGYLAAERYLYPGLVGAAWWLSSLPPPARARPLALGLAAASLLLHGLRAPQWRDDLALFSAATAALPRSSYAWHFLGMTLQMRGDAQGAADAFQRAVEEGHPHPEDHQRALAALIDAERWEEALGWAETGPKEGLTADTIALWALAAYRAGQVERARELLQMLQTPTGWDGPPWVPELSAKLP